MLRIRSNRYRVLALLSLVISLCAAVMTGSLHRHSIPWLMGLLVGIVVGVLILLARRLGVIRCR